MQLFYCSPPRIRGFLVHFNLCRADTVWFGDMSNASDSRGPRSMSLEQCGTSETHRWRLEPPLHFSPPDAQRTCHHYSSRLLQRSYPTEPLSKNSSRRIDWKSLQWHQSAHCLHSILQFFFSLCVRMTDRITPLLAFFLWLLVSCWVELSPDLQTHSSADYFLLFALISCVSHLSQLCSC